MGSRPTTPLAATPVKPAWLLTPPATGQSPPQQTKHFSDVMNKPLLTGPLGRIPIFHSRKTAAEPLFLDDEESGELGLLIPSESSKSYISNLGQSSTAATSSSLVTLERSEFTSDRPLKRHHLDDDEEDIEYCGGIFPNGTVTIGTKRARRYSVHDEEEEEEVEDSSGEEEEECDDGEEDEPMQEVQNHRQHQKVRRHQQGCTQCGCICQIIGSAPRGSGSGSQVLAPRVMGILLHLMLGAGQSPLQTISRVLPGIASWADIAEAVGARREDFDRVRHAAAGMQRDLPRKKARGEF